jgi:hypothetical protein
MTMSNTHTYKVNVVAYEVDGVWFAQCVEFDISAWAHRVDELPDAFLKELSATCAVNRHLGRQGLEGIPAAPDRFRQMWAEAAYDLTPRQHSVQARPVSIESFGIAHQAA